MLSRYACSKYRDQVSRVALGLRRDLPVFEQMPQPNLFAIRMAIALGAGIEKNYNDLSEAAIKQFAYQFSRLAEVGLRTAEKKSDGEYKPVMPEFWSWVLDPKFRYEGTKRMLDLVTSVEMPSVGEEEYKNDYIKTDKPVFPDNPASCIPPAVIAERIIQSLYRTKSGDSVQDVFTGYVNGGTWAYASEDQKDECARLLRAFGFDVKYSKKTKKEAVKLSKAQTDRDKQYLYSIDPKNLMVITDEWGEPKVGFDYWYNLPPQLREMHYAKHPAFCQSNPAEDQKQQEALHFNEMPMSSGESSHPEQERASPQYASKKVVKLSSFHKADVNVEIKKDLTKPEAPPTELSEMGSAEGNPDLDANMRSFLQSFLDKADADGMQENALMAKTGDDPVTNPPANDDILQQDKLGNNVSVADGKTEQIAPDNMKIKNYATTVAKVNAYIDLLHVADREQAETILVSHAQRLSTAAKISPEDAVTRIKANLQSFAENSGIENLEKNYKELYAGIPVTAAIVGRPGEKSNRYCNHERCKGTKPHTFTSESTMTCDSCGTKKDVVNKDNSKKAQMSPNDYLGSLKVVPMHGKFAIVDTETNQVLSDWPDEKSALSRINELYSKLRRRVEPDLVTAQQQQTVLSPEQKTILLNELSQKQSSGNLSPDQKALVDVGIQNLKQDLQTPANPAQPQQPQNPQVNQQQPVVPPAGGMQQPAAPVAKAATLIETAAKNGESLTVEQVESVSPLAAKKMREAGMAKVKAEYLIKRVLPYLTVEKELE